MGVLPKGRIGEGSGRQKRLFIPRAAGESFWGLTLLGALWLSPGTRTHGRASVSSRPPQAAWPHGMAAAVAGATVLAELPTVVRKNLPNTETRRHLENLSVLTLSLPWIRSQ